MSDIIAGMKKLEGKVVVVMGASGGIGRTLSKVFAQEGAQVILSARTEEKLRALESEIGSELATSVPLDATDPIAVAGMLNGVKGRFGRVDGIVITVGTWHRVSIDSDLEESHSRATQHYEAIFLPGFICGLVAQRFFREQGSGLIVSISSHAAIRPELKGNLTYGPMKAATRHLMLALRNELRGTGVRVVDIQPAIVNTPDNQLLLDTEEKRQGSVQPEDIGNWIADHFNDPDIPDEKLFDSSVVLD